MNDKLTEVWKNTSAGMRWCQIINSRGQETAKTVQAGRVFTITPFDRQLNQDMAATPGQDLFRNGTFVLVKAAESTVAEEIESTDSLTDAEVQSVVHDILAGDRTTEEIIFKINSPIALSRIYTQLILEEDAPQEAKDKVKAKQEKAEGSTVAVERTLVTEAPEPETVETPRGGIPTVETPGYVKTEPEKVG